MLKKCKRERIVVDGEVYLLGSDLVQSLRRIFNRFKLESADRTQGLLEKISAASDVLPPTAEEQSAELMDWAQVRDLRSGGHAIGSHAWSHKVLATLTPEGQVREIRQSSQRLREILRVDIKSFAYPVGGPRHYDRHSIEAVREAGHRLAFTFNTGVSSLPIADPLQIPRESASSLEVLKAKSLLPHVVGVRQMRVA
jgi:peptidoglycan/xylan/chitin deacetylase (PgdA/CDA1 family)